MDFLVLNKAMVSALRTKRGGFRPCSIAAIHGRMDFKGWQKSLVGKRVRYEEYLHAYKLAHGNVPSPDDIYGLSCGDKPRSDSGVPRIKKLAYADIASFGGPPDQIGDGMVVRANRAGCDRWELRSVVCEHDPAMDRHKFGTAPWYKVYYSE